MTQYDPTSKEAAQDLCYQITGRHDRWGDIKVLACDAYHTGLLIGRDEGRAECRQKIARLEAELERIKAELDTVCDEPTVNRSVVIEPAPDQEFDPPLPRTEHLGLVSPDASGCVEGEGFICELTPKVVAAIDESEGGEELEWTATDGLIWHACVDANIPDDGVIMFRNRWSSGERTFLVRLDKLPRNI